MKLYLMRHATAEEAGAGSDAARRLTESGQREARAAGSELKDRGASLAMILTSPRLRARETAEQVALGLESSVPIEVRTRLSCGATPEDYWVEIRAQDGDVLLVAHNPEISSFASGLTGQGVSFRPAMVCAFELDGDDARLLWHF